MPKAKPCTSEGCPFTKKPGHPRWCVWHWLLKQPAAVQTEHANLRLREAKRSTGYLFRGRVNESEWPDGHRWCAGCQSMVPLFYVRGSRCRGCASRDSHASHIKRTYGMDPEEYEALLEWQNGRCYVCGQEPKKLRLAVDHDHQTGAVRGLLCANDEFGCNVSLRRILGDPAAAARASAYAERPPLERFRAGEPRPKNGPTGTLPPIREQIRRSVLGLPASAPETPPGRAISGDWRSSPDWTF